jgi:two-component sensor histidine kinase
VLDLRTAFAASLIVDVALLFAALGVYLSYRKVVECTGCWLVAFTSTMVGHGLLALRNIVPNSLSIVIANLFLAISLIGAIVGASRLSQRRPPYKLLVAGLVVFVPALAYFALIQENLRIRALFINALIVLGSVLGAVYLAFPKDPERKAALRPGVSGFLSFALLFACRFLFVAIAGLTGNWMDAPDWDVWIFLVQIGVFAGLGFAYLRMIDGLLSMGLKKSATENALLLREVHHRSKNNLALISSLVSLQAESVIDPTSRAAFDGLQDRIRTISIVYRLLSSVNGDGRADASDYLRAVVAGIRDGLTIGRNIAFKVEAQSIELDSSQLVPIGLIVNELVTNSVKHAFQHGRPGTICVELAAVNGGAQLRVYDDGVGRVAGGGGKDGLGLTLIQSLSKQLHGKAQLESSPIFGTRFVLDFPLV